MRSLTGLHSHKKLTTEPIVNVTVITLIIPFAWYVGSTSKSLTDGTLKRRKCNSTHYKIISVSGIVDKPESSIVMKVELLLNTQS